MFFSDKIHAGHCKTVNCVYFVLLDLFFVAVQVFSCRVGLYLSDSFFCLRQPIRKLLQLLLLKIHQNFMQPGERRGDRTESWGCRGRNDIKVIGLIKFYVKLHVQLVI